MSYTASAQEEVAEDIEQAIDYADRTFSYGMRAGLNFSTFGEAEVLNPDRMTGLHIGLFARYEFSDVVGARVELIYSMQGARADEFSVFNDYAINLNYLNVPILLELTFADRVTVEAGPYVGFLVSSKQSFVGIDQTAAPVDIDDDETNTVDLGLALGATYNFNARWGLGLRYNIGFIDALGDAFLNDASGGNSVLQITTHYNF
jgi:hypothetical protein